MKSGGHGGHKFLYQVLLVFALSEYSEEFSVEYKFLKPLFALNEIAICDAGILSDFFVYCSYR